MQQEKNNSNSYSPREGESKNKGKVEKLMEACNSALLHPYHYPIILRVIARIPWKKMKQLDTTIQHITSPAIINTYTQVVCCVYISYTCIHGYITDVDDDRKLVVKGQKMVIIL